MIPNAILNAGWWLSAITCLLSDPQSGLQRYETEFAAMGVTFRMVMYAEHRQIFDQVSRLSRQRVVDIENSLSDYDRESEINRIVKSAPHVVPVRVSDDLWAVGQTSSRIYRMSHGAFDPTVGSVSRLWRLARKRNRLPEPAKIREAMKSVGWQHVRWYDDHRVRVAVSNLAFDFGGIAKGYAADQAVRICEKHGIRHVLVDAGGDIRVGQPPPGQSGWRIAMDRFPSVAARRSTQPLWRLSLIDRGVATSGDANQYLRKNGRVYSHVIDPRTGAAVENACAVTVIAPSAMEADALASALGLMGEQAGKALAEKTAGVEALFVCQDASGQTVRSWTSGFDKFVVESVADPASRLGDRLVDEKDD